MPEPTSRVRRAVEAQLGPDAARALERLRSMPDDLTERVQAGVVLAAGSSWDRFCHYAAMVEVDFRDVLVAADLADDDWPDRLDERLGPAAG